MRPTWGYLKNDVRALPLEAGRTLRIGRRPDSDLALTSRSISTDHAQLVVDEKGKQASLIDLGSLNGCFINNERLRSQRELLMHGDNVRFGFDPRVWQVDRGQPSTRSPSRSPKKEVGGGEGWHHSSEGAASREVRKARSPPRLPSGGGVNPSFFEPPPSPARMLREGDVISPWPPVEELRTSESGAPSEWSEEGLREEPSGYPPQGESGESGEGRQVKKRGNEGGGGEKGEVVEGGRSGEGEEAWRGELAELQAKLRSVQQQQGEQQEVERRRWKEEVGALQQQLRELKEQSSAAGGRGGGGGGGWAGGGSQLLTSPMPVRSPQSPKAHSLPAKYEQGGGGGGGSDLLASLEGLLADAAGCAHRLDHALRGYVRLERLPSPSPDPLARDPSPPTSGLLTCASDLVRKLQWCEMLTSHLPPTHPREVGGGEGSHDRLGRLVSLQQQQLGALRLRLGRRDVQMVALAGKDHGKALSLAEGEGRAAREELRRTQRELEELQGSVMRMELSSRREVGGGGGSVGAGGGGGGDGGGDLRAMIVEGAKEKAALREQLERLLQGVHATERRWSALEAERNSLRRECDGLRQQLDLAKRLTQQATERFHAARREAAGESRRVEERLASLARAGATPGARAKAAEFIIERLHAARGRVGEMEGRLQAQEVALAEARQALVVEQGKREGEGEGVGGAVQLELSQLRDQLREMREVCRPEQAQEQTRLLYILYKELRQQRKLVAQLEAALACGAGANGWEDAESMVDGSTVEGALTQLAHGLHLKKLEEQIEALSAAALAELNSESPPAQVPEEVRTEEGRGEEEEAGGGTAVDGRLAHVEEQTALRAAELERLQRGGDALRAGDAGGAGCVSSNTTVAVGARGRLSQSAQGGQREARGSEQNALAADGGYQEASQNANHVRASGVKEADDQVTQRDVSPNSGAEQNVGGSTDSRFSP